VAQADGFIAALDQSGGSTPKALNLYGYPAEEYVVGEDSMYDAVHKMRTRIISSPAFTGDRVFGAILFQDTVKRTINNQPVAEFLWKHKGIVPFLKIDQGLMEEENGVQLMKPILNLDDLLHDCEQYGIFGTKMRSVIMSDNAEGIKAVVEQQFEIGRKIASAGLVPIIEPEVAINSPSKRQCEEILKVELLKQLDRLQDDETVMLKVSLPSEPDFYKECIDHPRCLRVVALSGGYSREEATVLLRQQPKMAASFSRALTEGLHYSSSDEDFDRTLDRSIREICGSSNTI
jgi:fructose-bisphosphate aldolase class I